MLPQKSSNGKPLRLPMRSPRSNKTQEKRRQHHVWRKYLESWCVDGRLYCLQDGRIFSNAPQNLAVESYFYRLEKLTKEDVRLYRQLLVEQGDAQQKESHERFLKMMTLPFDVIERFKHLDGDPKHASAFEEILKTYRTNALEDYYAGIEGEFGPVLDKLLADDLSVLLDRQTAVTSFYFLATQYMRTKRIREAWIKGFEGSSFNIDRIMPLLALQYGENIGRSLFLDRKRISSIVLNNSTGVEFITGDQPVINLLAAADQQATELSLYYPLSPTKALLLSDSGRKLMVTNDTFSERWAIELNRKIIQNSRSQVFARTPKILEALRS